MATKTIEEAEHTRLTEAAGRVPELEKELAEAKRERDEAEADLAHSKAVDTARTAIGEAATAEGVELTPLEVKGLLAYIPMTEAGGVDTEAIKKTIAEAAASAKEAAGAGKVSGFGASAASSGGPLTEADKNAKVADLFGRKVG